MKACVRKNARGAVYNAIDVAESAVTVVEVKVVTGPVVKAHPTDRPRPARQQRIPRMTRAPRRRRSRTTRWLPSQTYRLKRMRQSILSRPMENGHASNGHPASNAAASDAIRVTIAIAVVTITAVHANPPHRQRVVTVTALQDTHPIM